MSRTARQKRDLLRLTDLGREELLALLERAAEWKLLGRSGPHPLQGMTVGLIFEKASTRTRVSFGVGSPPRSSVRSGGLAIRPTVVSRRLTHSIGSASAAKP